MGVSINWGPLFGSPYNKDHSILGSILGPPIYGSLHMITNILVAYSRVYTVYSIYIGTCTHIQSYDIVCLKSLDFKI